MKPSTRSLARLWAAPVGAALAALLIFGLTGCGQKEERTPAQKGRTLYSLHCIACHNSEPSLAGPVGPPLRGSSRELLDAKLLKGTYPPGYTPKRPSAVMQPMPHLASSVSDLAAYLK